MVDTRKDKGMFPIFYKGDIVKQQGVLRHKGVDNTPSKGFFCMDKNRKEVYPIPPKLGDVDLQEFDEIDYRITSDKGTYYFAEVLKIYPRKSAESTTEPKAEPRAYKTLTAPKIDTTLERYSPPLAEAPALPPLEVTTEATLHFSRVKDRFIKLYIGKKEIKELKAKKIDMDAYANRIVQLTIKHAGGEKGVGGFRNRRHKYS